MHIGGDNMVFCGVYGPPFVREGDVRRDADDGRLRELRPAGPVVPAARLARRDDLRAERPPLDSRHLDMVYALQTLSDKPYMGSVTSGPNAGDTIA